jgi:hypothetical protein
MGTALIYRLIQQAASRRFAPSAAETLSQQPAGRRAAGQMRLRASGVDTRRRSNHDLVKEAVTLFWYAALD